MTALGSAASLAAVPVFGKIKPLLRREMSSGIHPVAIGAGKMMSHALAIFWFAVSPVLVATFIYTMPFICIA